MLGIDGGTFDVLDQLTSTGIMPGLQDLMERSARARLGSTVNWLTPQAWTTATSGRTPGNHGVFDFVRAEERPGGLYFTLTDSRDVKCETIWSTVSRYGRRIAALNLPAMFPPRPVNGMVVPGFVPWRHLRRYTYPADAFDSIRVLPGFDLKRLGMDIDLERQTVQGLRCTEMAAWIRHHILRERQWATILDHVLDLGDTDLVAINFDGNDKLLHLFWRFIISPDGAEFRSWERDIRELCLDYYRELDAHLVRAVAAAGPGARIFVVSDHGFGPSDEVVYLNAWLQRRGYLAWGDRAPLDQAGALTVDRLRHHVEMIDWDRTLAYVLTPSSNGICIRVARRPGDPGVDPADYGRFRSQLAAELTKLTSPVDGGRVIVRVRTREEAYPGQCSDRAPDLLVTLRDGGFVSILNSDHDVRCRDEIVGTHREHGILLASGPGIEPNPGLTDQSIVDLAPTLLRSLDIPPPATYEGEAMAIFDDSRSGADNAALDSDPAWTDGELAPLTSRHDGAYSRQEEAQILSQLESLGYI
jgi:predicted AlkP superfamily phosphohydrolase/phosphomutase